MPDLRGSNTSDQSHAALTVAFAGSPAFAAKILDQLVGGALRPELVLTQPDRPKGRGRRLEPNAVKRLAMEFGLAVEQPRSLRKADAIVERLRTLDVLAVAAYGLILPEAVLSAPRFGCINVHASLLPRWRGAAPVERAIMAGDAQTGVSIMHMEAGLDTGPVYRTQATPIDPDETAGVLEARLATIGGDLLLEVLGDFASAKAKHGPPPTPSRQDDELATYAEKLGAADREVDWSLDAHAISRRIMALADRAPVTLVAGELRIQLLRARAVPSAAEQKPGTITRADKSGIYVQCANGQLQIIALRLNRGKGAIMDPGAALNGYSSAFAVGCMFSTTSSG